MEGLQRYVSVSVGKRVSVTSLCQVLGMNPSTYYRRVAQPDFPNAAHCVIAARHFGLDPVALLLAFGHLTTEDLAPYRCTVA